VTADSASASTLASATVLALALASVLAMGAAVVACGVKNVRMAIEMVNIKDAHVGFMMRGFFIRSYRLLGW
jgi:hypothetical protein